MSTSTTSGSAKSVRATLAACSRRTPTAPPYDSPPAATRGQWWDYSRSQENRDMIFLLIGDSLRRLGLNDWWPAGEGKSHDPMIDVPQNYYNTTSLVFFFDGRSSPDRLVQDARTRALHERYPPTAWSTA
ncbi:MULTISPECIES: hypothetical protein [unclassified Streptomyces]|uniref:hypothetical protein n=1 Tax=unclassified Streptomyces TaxID=2593676 RepID=UPI0023669735|nr:MULTISPECIES: hypothetical protein [unclassified Streptomyces]MDF3139856.1 hypothetical protein [Streptomyces sp. T21Q-yed]WDF41914.1 hypothetical protein PBV52_36495 [Streptomyces sp. T12]